MRTGRLAVGELERSPGARGTRPLAERAGRSALAVRPLDDEGLALVERLELQAGGRAVQPRRAAG